jgi:hypothetical protein
VDLDTDQRDELFRGLSDRATVRGDIEFYRYVNECSYHFYMFLDRNDSGQAHFTVKMPVRKEGGRSARLLIYTDTPV